MDLISGYPYWLVRDGMPFDYDYLSTDIESEVAIIGGGISGALSAYHLAEAGISCLVIDAREIGQGSTCASTSLLQYELDIPLHELTQKIGKLKAERVYRLTGDAIIKLVYIMDSLGFRDYEQCKSLFFSGDDKHDKFMINEWNARKNAGFSVELISQKSIKKDYGLEAKFGILSSLGAWTDAYGLTHALFQHCIKKGVPVFARSRITGIENGQRIVLKTDKGFSIRVKKIIQASGYEVVQFIGRKWVDFDCTYAIVSEKLPQNTQILNDRVMMWNAENPYLYLRFTKDNRIILGGKDDPFSNSFASEHRLEKKCRSLTRELSRLFPEIEFRIDYCWCGTFGKTKDALPYIGRMKNNRNIFYALGFGGNGIPFGLIAAEMIRNQIQGKSDDTDGIFSFDR